MRFKVTRVDIEKTRANWPDGNFAPALVAARDSRDNHVWHVLDKPVNLTHPHNISWAIASGDEYIRIPLFAYDAPPQGDLALAFMFQLGLICGNFPQRTFDIVHIVTGNPAELVYDASGAPAELSGWLGAAFTFKD